MEQFDVVIAGGGMVGAAAALGMARQGRKVAVIEGEQPTPYNNSQAMDLRVSAISAQSVKLLKRLNAWDNISAMRLCPFRRLETWEHPECRTRFNAADLALSELGFMVENRVIQLGLWQAFEGVPNLTLICPARLAQFERNEAGYQVTLDNGQVLQSRWLVGADGANSRVRQQANIGITAWDYRQHCMLIHVETELPQQDITWQQFTPQGPRSFLPLPGHQGSLVWYDSPARIKQLSAMTSAQLEAEILKTFPTELGPIKVLNKGSFPLTRRHAQSYYSEGIVLLGDAAHTINPLAGQGVNLGFKDVDVLLDEMANGGQYWFETQVLKRYEQRRRPDNLFMQTGMDVFYKAFSNDLKPVVFMRNLGLKLAEHTGPLKHKVLQYALGL
ncbi:2-octaprenyl-3-methyl-6-methoxy-1,4-benzoquinol hydroxylase [Photobacterium galatheae]|uniref:2-octaprenyl-3-methyl-6-methoxy-1,4-benzoquinol hydroxylase n=1 Tax=Photobacterium galatheae TaxID=1654360 RepID=A0A066RV12_9GAMM|nr:2-octaprenyl-3-methyl-6-methoxy-1,4-benzoquinol hydroxylase [Photobacterium galatheae]KDM91198.1 2-octaprenyl-3-methyl-6-methoxy-1,4-benzoquinol hydroxylase [Photobacterium galatheae]MCM0148545.1 2-octaprenyl-3-methyl-6-methoxy-1,4-benzoquinol hydroxylase [Photobacterium galatheae]